MSVVATRYAVRVMGVWVRRADALIADGGVANAAHAVAADQARQAGGLVELVFERGAPAPLAVAG